MDYQVSITEDAYYKLFSHLFPGDGLEAVAIALCGRLSYNGVEKILLSNPILVPHEECERLPDFIKWQTTRLAPLLETAMKKNMAIVKIHSHPGGFDDFSAIDDRSDTELFDSVYGWTQTDNPHASLVMLPDGRIFGRVVLRNLDFHSIRRVAVVGDNIKMFDAYSQGQERSFDLRNRQLFGEGTISLLREMKVAVIGCSGTGSPVIEQLARLGVGKLVLVDPDKVETKNLNRILNTTEKDALAGRQKTEVLKEAIEKIHHNIVEAFPVNLYDSLEVIKTIASADVIFGCVDSVDGRHLLNTIASFYLIPYFDLGVKLLADGKGGIDQVAGTIHYIQPGKSSLRTRRLYNEEDLRAASLFRYDPVHYNNLRKLGYITNVNVDRPAVISVNMLIASLAVNEFLARIHPYRSESNDQHAITRISLKDSYMQYECESDLEADFYLKKFEGRGDLIPLLNMPELSAHA